MLLFVAVVQYLQPDGGVKDDAAKLNKTCGNRQATPSWLEASCAAADAGADAPAASVADT